MSEAQAAVETESNVEPANLETLSDFPINDELKRVMATLGYAPPPAGWKLLTELALQGRNIVVRSEPGAVKTNAYGIPLVDQLKVGDDKPEGPQALIIVPTRELAQGVSAELRKLTRDTSARVVSLFGGVPLGRQVGALKNGADVVVSTPGRLLDHVRRGNVTLETIGLLILDDADELVSMSLWNDVLELLGQLPDSRQTILLSSVQNPALVKAIDEFLSGSEEVNLTDATFSAEGVEHRTVVVGESSEEEDVRAQTIATLLESYGSEGSVVFCDTAEEADRVSKQLSSVGYPAKLVKGATKPRERERLATRVEEGKLTTLVATDVATRGLNLAKFGCAIHYSTPEFPEVYVHRVSRLKAEGKTPVSITLRGEDSAGVDKLASELGISFEEATLPSEEEVAKARGERHVRELLNAAKDVDAAAFVDAAKGVIESASATDIVAFLLHRYQERQRSRTSSRRGGRDRAESENSDQETAGRDERRDDREERGARRSRRSRRGRRGRNNRDNHMDVVDAGQMLGGRNDAPVEDSEEFKNYGADVEVEDGFQLVRVNIGYDDGFKGRGAVAKKISALAGITDGHLTEVEAQRHFSLLKASADTAELVVERVDGAQIGKKVLAAGLTKAD